MELIQLKPKDNEPKLVKIVITDDGKEFKIDVENAQIPHLFAAIQHLSEFLHQVVKQRLNG